MNGLIVFCLFGQSSKYIIGLYDNLDVIASIYPGWDVRVYVEEHSHVSNVISSRYPFVDIVRRPSERGRIGCLWRCESIWDTAYSHVIFRDTDSIVSTREAELVQQWVQSGKAMHVIYDHPNHTAPVMAGMWGCMPQKFGYMQDEFRSWKALDIGRSQKFLETHAFLRTPECDILTHTSARHDFYKGKIIQIKETIDFIGKPRTPDFPSHLRNLYVLNPDRYVKRYEGFVKNIASSKILSSLELIRVRGSTHAEEPEPYWFRESQGDTYREHYWLANQDHKCILKQALREYSDLTLVMEDDARISEDFDAKFLKLLVDSDHCTFSERKFAPWSAIMLGGSDWEPNANNFDQITPDLRRITGMYGQHAVLYNYAGLHGFYGYAMRNPDKNIDVSFAAFQAVNRTVYAPNKWIVTTEGPQNGTDE